MYIKFTFDSMRHLKTVVILNYSNVILFVVVYYIKYCKVFFFFLHYISSYMSPLYNRYKSSSSSNSINDTEHRLKRCTLIL